MDEKQILLNVIQEQALTNANQLIQIKALEAHVADLNEKSVENTEDKGDE